MGPCRSIYHRVVIVPFGGMPGYLGVYYKIVTGAFRGPYYRVIMRAFRGIV